MSERQLCGRFIDREGDLGNAPRPKGRAEEPAGAFSPSEADAEKLALAVVPSTFANAVLGDLVKRLTNGVVLLLAAITFFLVPVGRKTPAQHMVAILSTPPAREAGAAFMDTVRQAFWHAKIEFAKLRSGRADDAPAPAEASPAPADSGASPAPE